MLWGNRMALDPINQDEHKQVNLLLNRIVMGKFEVTTASNMIQYVIGSIHNAGESTRVK